MVLYILIVVLVLFLINYIPCLLLVSSNRYSYFQEIIFGLLFIGIWFYNIQSQIEIDGLKKMELNEVEYTNTHRSRARVKLKFHNPYEYIAINLNKVENQIEDRQNKVGFLLKILTIDALIVTLLAVAGRRKYGAKKEFYSKKIYLYAGFTIFCFVIEILNNLYFIE